MTYKLPDRVLSMKFKPNSLSTYWGLRKPSAVSGPCFDRRARLANCICFRQCCTDCTTLAVGHEPEPAA
jgi:hypothetical protein